MEIVDMLNELDTLRRRMSEAAMLMQARLDALYSEEVKAAAQALHDEYAEYVNPLAEAHDRLEASIKRAVSEHGATVKGNSLQAVFTAGRVAWDSKALDGYAVANPDVMRFRTVGQPSVSIRAAK